MVNAGLVNPGKPRFQCIYEPYGQDESAINITLTCRTFYTHGRKLFWEHNVFRFDTICCLEDFMPEPRCNWIHHLFIHIHINVDSTGDIVGNLIGQLRICEPRTALKTLQIHFITTTGSYNCLSETTGMEIWMQLVWASIFYSDYLREQQTHKDLALQKTQNSESDSPIHEKVRGKTGLALDEFIITGLPGNELRLNALMLRLASTAVNSHGKIGLGMADEGRKFWISPTIDEADGIYITNKNPRLEWVQAGDVDDWVSEHAWKEDISTKSAAGAVLHQDLQTEQMSCGWKFGHYLPFFKGWV